MVLNSVYVAQMTGFCLLALLHKLYCRRYSKEFHSRLYVLVSVVMLLFSVYGIGCAARVKVRQEIVELKGVKQEQKLLYITDLHAGTTLSTPYNTIKRLAGKCDIVLLGGDLFDESTSQRIWKLFVQCFPICIKMFTMQAEIMSCYRSGAGNMRQCCALQVCIFCRMNLQW